MFRPAYNRTDRPVLIDSAGRQLGGREWGPVDTTADEVKAAVAAGELKVQNVEAFADDAAPDAKAAAERAGVLEQRRTAYSGVDVDALRKAAVAAELVPNDEAAKDLPKGDLQARLVHVDRDPAELLPKARRSGSSSAGAAGSTPTIPEATS